MFVRRIRLWVVLRRTQNSSFTRFNQTCSYDIKASESSVKQDKPEIYRTKSKGDTRAASDASPGQSLRHHLTVHDGDVDEEEEDDEEIIHEAQQTDHALRDEVQRRGQVRQRAHQTQQDPDAEHPEEAADGEHLSEGVPEQRGNVPQTVQQLQESNTNAF